MQVNHARRRELEIQGTPIRPLFALNVTKRFRFGVIFVTGYHSYRRW